MDDNKEPIKYVKTIVSTTTVKATANLIKVEKNIPWAVFISSFIFSIIADIISFKIPGGWSLGFSIAMTILMFFAGLKLPSIEIIKTDVTKRQ